MHKGKRWSFSCA